MHTWIKENITQKTRNVSKNVKKTLASDIFIVKLTNLL